MRLDERTPVRLARQESLTEVRRKIGRPGLTWMKLAEKDLRSVEYLKLNDSTPEEIITKLVDLTKDRAKWNKIVRDIMAVNRRICIDVDESSSLTQNDKN